MHFLGTHVLFGNPFYGHGCGAGRGGGTPARRVQIETPRGPALVTLPALPAPTSPEAVMPVETPSSIPLPTSASNPAPYIPPTYIPPAPQPPVYIPPDPGLPAYRPQAMQPTLIRTRPPMSAIARPINPVTALKPASSGGAPLDGIFDNLSLSDPSTLAVLAGGAFLLFMLMKKPKGGGGGAPFKTETYFR